MGGLNLGKSCKSWAGELFGDDFLEAFEGVMDTTDGAGVDTVDTDDAIFNDSGE